VTTFWLWGPWVLMILILMTRLRLPQVLPPHRPGRNAPLVSVIIPARNEELNIQTCVESIARAEYDRFEIIIVDDRSEDRTAELARAVPRGNAERVLVLDGAELPDGWLGKPWACEQGADHARGDLLLFTDADTTHGPSLLPRVVATLEADGSDAITIMGKQLTGTFWERLIQPHVFVMLLLRFPDLRGPLPPGRWRDAIANGQFILFTRSTYEGVGRHEAVQGEVVEDLRMGQLLVQGGYRFTGWRAEDVFATRMYRSLSDIIEGWSKNVAIATRMTVPRGVAIFALPVTTLGVLYFWVFPPVMAALWVVGAVTGAVGAIALGVTAFSILLWTAVCYRFEVPPYFGLLYPAGSLATLAIFARSWLRGSRVEWKGREYFVEVKP
jgi:chlorobactene glucosyltransferase